MRPLTIILLFQLLSVYCKVSIILSPVRKRRPRIFLLSFYCSALATVGKGASTGSREQVSTPPKCHTTMSKLLRCFGSPREASFLLGVASVVTLLKSQMSFVPLHSGPQSTLQSMYLKSNSNGGSCCIIQQKSAKCLLQCQVLVHIRERAIKKTNICHFPGGSMLVRGMRQPQISSKYPLLQLVSVMQKNAAG